MISHRENLTSKRDTVKFPLQKSRSIAQIWLWDTRSWSSCHWLVILKITKRKWVHDCCTNWPLLESWQCQPGSRKKRPSTSIIGLLFPLGCYKQNQYVLMTAAINLVILHRETFCTYPVVGFWHRVIEFTLLSCKLLWKCWALTVKCIWDVFKLRKYC